MSMRNKKILVVEDSDALRKMMAIRLTKLGAEVMQAVHGKEALELTQTNEIDLIISDVKMPEMDGFALCKAIKADKTLRRIPIILLSAMDGTTDVDEGFNAGASAYLLKSASDQDLEKTIMEVLDQSSLQRGSTIMVVDDSITILRLTETGLSKAGFDVVTAQNGAEALAKLETIKPDIIVSDLDMPVMNGIEFCNRLSTDSRYSGIPFMIMSANSERSTMRSMISLGASAYMVKPFNMEQFVITVEKLLSEQFQMLNLERRRLELERNSMLNSITALINALEARDTYTSGHSRRVSEYSVAIGRELKLKADDLETLRIGSTLHDLGKIGVPDALLLKNGKLTEAEIHQFNYHPAIGAEILKPIPSLDKMIPVVLMHHEHIDGTGYPNKLKGEEIPLMARICAVADCYDALTTDRPYRKGFSKEKALTIIEEIKGTQLCETCVEAFYRWANNNP